MSIYLDVGSTAHKMSKLYVGVDGQARQVQKMYVGVDGQARLVYQSGTPIASQAVGNTVYIKINGVATAFVVIYQGRPSTTYDASCDGTWLLARDIYTTSAFGSDNSYKDSAAHSYLNGDFFDLLDTDVKKAVKQVKIPYHNGNGVTGRLNYGANGLSTKVFLLSATEVGFTASSNMDSGEGARLPYFSSATKRLAYTANGSAYTWYLRSPYTDSNGHVWCVTSRGSSYQFLSSGVYGIRPALILPSSALVDDGGNVLG